MSGLKFSNIFKELNDHFNVSNEDKCSEVNDVVDDKCENENLNEDDLENDGQIALSL